MVSNFGKPTYSLKYRTSFMDVPYLTAAPLGFWIKWFKEEPIVPKVPILNHVLKTMWFNFAFSQKSSVSIEPLEPPLSEPLYKIGSYEQ